MKAKLIINPKAGIHRENIHKVKSALTGMSQGDQIKTFLSEENIEVDIFETKKSGDATKIAKDVEGYDMVIGAGGDGTVNEVVNGLNNFDVSLGIIPLGSENVFAKELKIPLRIKNSCKVIGKGKTRKVDVGVMNKKRFIFVAGIGFDAHAIKNVRQKVKKILGKHSYTLAGLKTLFEHKPEKIKISFNGKETFGYFAIISNVKRYGGRIKVTPNAKLDDGYLDMCVFKNKDLLSVMRYVMGAASKQMHLTENIERYKIKKGKITCEKPVLYHTDAEIGGKTPVEVDVLAKTLRVVVP